MTPNTLNTLLRHAGQHDKLKPSAIENISINVAKPPILVDTLAEHTLLAFILSGEQEIFLGEQCYAVQAGDVLFVPFNMPIKVQFKLDKRPQFVSLNLALDEKWLGEIIQKIQTINHHASSSGVAITKITAPVQNCLARLIDQLDDPNLALAELYKQELMVHLLSTSLGASLAAFVSQDSHLHKIKKASDHLYAHFADKITVAQLADLSGMGESSFYHHFKAVTGFSPLQYQKQLRLNHANFLILTEKRSVSETAFAVGYESLSQFSREYKRAFGVSPRDDVDKNTAFG
ncbi:helix-turn-helix domain-containing protein [Neisseria sp. CCUG12390]|uniref:AraC family transcriptional regulator n=1 Tax=Neisseria sp. CCUG12390 TaxID=3392035 RepID=UPI003A0FC763